VLHVDLQYAFHRAVQVRCRSRQSGAHGRLGRAVWRHRRDGRLQRLRSIKQFTRWLVRDRRTSDDRLAHLSKLNVQTDRRHDRRALTDVEFPKLVNSAMTGPVVEAVSGPDRAMMYVLSCWTGYRRKELASLTSRSFDLDSDTPSVRVQAAYSKNGRTDETPLHSAVVERLRAWLSTKGNLDADAPLFPLRTPGGHWRKTHKMMKLDLERAGIPYQDEDGLFADFHSNRDTFITNLGRARVPLVTAQKLARHHDPKLTSNVYTHLGLSDKASAIESLPTPPSEDSNAERGASVLQATGTDNTQPYPPPDDRLPNACQTTRTRRQLVAQPDIESDEERAVATKSQVPTLTGVDASRHGQAQPDSSIPERIRTSNLRLRRPTLYPIELRGQMRLTPCLFGIFLIAGRCWQ